METLNSGELEGGADVTPTTPEERKNAATVLEVFYGYHQGPRPRWGSRVRVRRQSGTVHAHQTNGTLYIEFDDGTKRTAKLTEATADSGRRLSLSEALSKSTDLACKTVDTVHVHHLLNHFRGDNGLRYANRPAMLWCVHALCALGILGEKTYMLCDWLADELRAAECAAELPPIPDEEFRNVFRGNGSLSDPRGQSVAALLTASETARSSVEKAIELGAESLALAETDTEQSHETDGLERCLAFDVSTQKQVVILGPSVAGTGHGFLDVIDLDSLYSAARHITGLEVSGDAVDPGWLWDLVTQSVLKHPKGPAVLWFAHSLSGPEGVDVDLVERRRVAAIACLMAMRFSSGRGINPAARRYLKRARELARGLEKAERGHLAAVAPELVAPDTRGGRRIAPMDVLIPHLRSAVQAMLIVLPAPEAVTSRSSTLDQKVDPAPAEPIPVASVPVHAPRHEKVSFVRPAKPLRFNVTDHQLLAMEWQLQEGSGAHAAAVATALEWLEQRLGTSLPKHWREGAHEIERAGVSVQIEASSKLFAFRLEHPDLEHPTRWWRVEVTVLEGRAGIGGMVGLRMHVRDLVDLPPPSRTVPALVRALSSKPGLRVAGARAGHVLHIRDQEQFGRLQAIIKRHDRGAPVIAVAEGGVRLPAQGPLAGLARIIVVSAEASGYAERYGTLAPDCVHVFAGHTGRPEVFHATGPDWQDRLRALALDLRQYNDTPSFRDVRDAIRAYRDQQSSDRGTVGTANTEITPSEFQGAPSLESAGEPADELDTEARSQTGAEVAASAPAPTGPSLEDIQIRVRREVREYEELLEVAEAEREQALIERDAAQAEALALRHALSQLSQRDRATVSSRAEVPVDLEGLGQWAPSIRPRVVVADKAIRIAARCQHNDVPKIYAALQALHDFYWVMRFGSEDDRDDAHGKWREFLATNRLTLSPVGTAARTGRYQDEYRANVDGEAYLASLHVAGSSSHDPLRCLRIYLDVDEELERLVVVHLPTHLTNSLT